MSDILTDDTYVSTRLDIVDHNEACETPNTPALLDAVESTNSFVPTEPRNTTPVVQNRRQKRAEMFALKKVLRKRYKQLLLNKSLEFSLPKLEEDDNIQSDNNECKDDKEEG